MSARRPLSAMNDVRTMGGKEAVLNRMVNHYKTLANIKPKIDVTAPFRLSPRNNTDIKTKMLKCQEFQNVRHTYKGVSNVKPRIDNNNPQTLNIIKSTGNRQTEQFEDMEHIRRLNAMSKRILSLGKPHERKKNINDPISHPTYFFRRPDDKDAVKLVDLETFNKKLNDMNSHDKNKLLLNEAIYSTLSEKNYMEYKQTKTRPKSATHQDSKYYSKVGKYTYSNNDPSELIKKHIAERKKIETPQTNNIKTENSMYKKLLAHIDKNSVPVIDKRREDYVEAFKFQIMQFILANRIYKEYDLEGLVRLLKLGNKQFLEDNEVDELFADVKRDLEE